MRCIVIAAVSAVLLATAAGAQARADFSGRWISEPPAAVPSARDAAAERARPADRTVDLGSGWGRTITIAQNERSLTVDWPYFSAYELQPPLRFAYALDGSESINTIMLGRGMQRQRSRTEWAGSALVITTAHSFTDPSSGRRVDTEVRQTLTLESPTSLVVETLRSGALGGPPSTTRTVYTKGGGT